MSELTSSQYKTLSEFFNNVAVAWFAAGVVAPIIVRPNSLIELISMLGWGLMATVLFLKLSLEYTRGKQ